MTKRNEVKDAKVDENVAEETKVGFFTKMGIKADNGVKFVKQHWKPIAGVGTAAVAAAAGFAAYKGFNGNDLDNLDSLNEEDPMA